MTSASTPSPRESLETLRQLVSHEHVAMLTTVAPDGSLRSRPMATQAMDQHHVLWFFTRVDSGKVDEVDRDEHVNVAYANPAKNHYVSISGLGRVVRNPDKIRELWQAPLKAWFPDGPDDPQIALLRVQAYSAEYWDGPSSRMVSLFKMATAALSRREPDMGDHGEVKLG